MTQHTSDSEAVGMIVAFSDKIATKIGRGVKK